MKDVNRIPIPLMSDFLYEDFMLPMNIDARAVANGADLPLEEVQSILANDSKITPEISEKLGNFFGVSSMLFYDIQRDICRRKTKIQQATAEFA